MKISIIGTGYVGLVSGTCLAEIGHQVTCIDVVKEKIDLLNTGVSPIYEPGLEELIKRNAKNDSLHFSTDYKSVTESDAIFLAVGTPSNELGEANLEYLKSAAVSVAGHQEPERWLRSAASLEILIAELTLGCWSSSAVPVAPAAVP